MFYIDTLSMKVELFDYNNGQISNRRTLVEISDGMGYPDGMCSDSEDNIWVAFWMGSCVRGFDGKTGKQIAEIKLPVQKVTSCCFAGEKLDQLIITTAIGNPGILALKAALTEKDSEYLFYLHDKSGTIHYAKNFDEHKRNIKAYLD
jgi:sugar lactone lactonase YvrE